MELVSIALNVCHVSMYKFWCNRMLSDECRIYVCMYIIWFEWFEGAKNTLYNEGSHLSWKQCTLDGFESTKGHSKARQFVWV